MSEYKSLSVWLNGMQEQCAWMNGDTLTRLSFKFKVGAVLLTVSRTTSKGKKEVAWIESSDCRECLVLLYKHYTFGSYPIRWKEDEFST